MYFGLNELYIYFVDVQFIFEYFTIFCENNNYNFLGDVPYNYYFHNIKLKYLLYKFHYKYLNGFYSLNVAWGGYSFHIHYFSENIKIFDVFNDVKWFFFNKLNWKLLRIIDINMKDISIIFFYNFIYFFNNLSFYDIFYNWNIYFNFNSNLFYNYYINVSYLLQIYDIFFFKYLNNNILYLKLFIFKKFFSFNLIYIYISNIFIIIYISYYIYYIYIYILNNIYYYFIMFMLKNKILLNNILFLFFIYYRKYFMYINNFLLMHLPLNKNWIIILNNLKKNLLKTKKKNEFLLNFKFFILENKKIKIKFFYLLKQKKFIFIIFLFILKFIINELKKIINLLFYKILLINVYVLFYHKENFFEKKFMPPDFTTVEDEFYREIDWEEIYEKIEYNIDNSKFYRNYYIIFFFFKYYYLREDRLLNSKQLYNNNMLDKLLIKKLINYDRNLFDFWERIKRKKKIKKENFIFRKFKNTLNNQERDMLIHYFYKNYKDIDKFNLLYVEYLLIFYNFSLYTFLYKFFQFYKNEKNYIFLNFYNNFYLKIIAFLSFKMQFIYIFKIILKFFNFWNFFIYFYFIVFIFLLNLFKYKYDIYIIYYFILLKFLKFWILKNFGNYIKLINFNYIKLIIYNLNYYIKILYLFLYKYFIFYFIKLFFNRFIIFLFLFFSIYCYISIDYLFDILNNLFFFFNINFYIYIKIFYSLYLFVFHIILKILNNFIYYFYYLLIKIIIIYNNYFYYNLTEFIQFNDKSYIVIKANYYYYVELIKRILDDPFILTKIRIKHLQWRLDINHKYRKIKYIFYFILYNHLNKNYLFIFKKFFIIVYINFNLLLKWFYIYSVTYFIFFLKKTYILFLIYIYLYKLINLIFFFLFKVIFWSSNPLLLIREGGLKIYIILSKNIFNIQLLYNIILKYIYYLYLIILDILNISIYMLYNIFIYFYKFILYIIYIFYNKVYYIYFYIKILFIKWFNYFNVYFVNTNLHVFHFKPLRTVSDRRFLLLYQKKRYKIFVLRHWFRYENIVAYSLFLKDFKLNFLEINSFWNINKFLATMIHYLFIMITILMLLSILSLNFRNILKNKKLINYNFFYSWQRINLKNIDKLTILEHYLLKDNIWLNDLFLIPFKNEQINYDSYLKLNKQELKNYYYIFMYTLFRFETIQKYIEYLFLLKIRGTRGRYKYLSKLKFWLPYNYYYKYKKLFWLKSFKIKKDFLKNIGYLYMNNNNKKNIFSLSKQQIKRLYICYDFLYFIRKKDDIIDIMFTVIDFNEKLGGLILQKNKESANYFIDTYNSYLSSNLEFNLINYSINSIILRKIDILLEYIDILDKNILKNTLNFNLYMYKKNFYKIKTKLQKTELKEKILSEEYKYYNNYQFYSFKDWDNVDFSHNKLKDLIKNKFDMSFEENMRKKEENDNFFNILWLKNNEISSYNVTIIFIIIIIYLLSYILFTKQFRLKLPKTLVRNMHVIYIWILVIIKYLNIKIFLYIFLYNRMFKQQYMLKKMIKKKKRLLYVKRLNLQYIKKIIFENLKLDNFYFIFINFVLIINFSWYHILYWTNIPLILDLLILIKLSILSIITIYLIIIRMRLNIIKWFVL